MAASSRREAMAVGVFIVQIIRVNSVENVDS